jgi:hypothetical protein
MCDYPYCRIKTGLTILSGNEKHVEVCELHFEWGIEQTKEVEKNDNPNV